MSKATGKTWRQRGGEKKTFSTRSSSITELILKMSLAGELERLALQVSKAQQRL